MYKEASVKAEEVMTLREAHDRQTLLLQETDLRLKEFESSKRELEEVKVLQKRLVNLPSLEREVARLREETAESRTATRQNLLLEEQVQYFKNRMETLEPLYQNYCDIQVRKFVAF